MPRTTRTRGAAARILLIGLLAVAAAGCKDWKNPFAPKPPPTPKDDIPRTDPLPVQQARAYPETVTKQFFSLADFEALRDLPPGHEQVEYFRFEPTSRQNSRTFVVNITRTGAGAMAVALAPGCELVFRVPYERDFSAYTLLTFALHSKELRDDLRVALVSRGATWTSHRTLIRPGWNYVQIDIQRLADIPNFDRKDVREVRIAMAKAARPVTFHIDDVMLVNNRRAITPVPPGFQLEKIGRNYMITAPFLQPRLALAQDTDGFWRMGQYQPVVQVLPPGASMNTAAGEYVSLLGPRRVGDVQIAEHNALRLRLVNTWYFPAQAGEWLSLAIRKVQWVCTFYADGRWVTHMELNNAGGKQMGSVHITLPTAAAVSGQGIAGQLTTTELLGPVGQWDYLLAPASNTGRQMQQNFLRPATVRVALGKREEYALNDFDRDRFDQSEGCYYLAADDGGHCRFTLVPTRGPLVRPVIRVAGEWEGKVHVQSEGRRVENVVRLDDGSVLFVLPETFDQPRSVEVSGKTPLLRD